MLDEFFAGTGIHVDWQSSGEIWRYAGRVFQAYARRRGMKKGELPRRILADFLIGAHASVRHYRLLTLDQRLDRAAFPDQSNMHAPPFWAGYEDAFDASAKSTALTRRRSGKKRPPFLGGGSSQQS